jgi:hypothetical protein
MIFFTTGVVAHLLHRRPSKAVSSPLSTSKGFLFCHKAHTIIPIIPKIMRNQLTHILVMASPSGTSYRNFKYNPPKIKIADRNAIKYLISNCIFMKHQPLVHDADLLSDPMEAPHYRSYDSRICDLISKPLSRP